MKRVVQTPRKNCKFSYRPDILQNSWCYVGACPVWVDDSNISTKWCDFLGRNITIGGATSGGITFVIVIKLYVYIKRQVRIMWNMQLASLSMTLSWIMANTLNMTMISLNTIWLISEEKRGHLISHSLSIIVEWHCSNLRIDDTGMMLIS